MTTTDLGDGVFLVITDQDGNADLGALLPANSRFIASDRGDGIIALTPTKSGGPTSMEVTS